jgi:hypothetical protein
MSLPPPPKVSFDHGKSLMTEDANDDDFTSSIPAKPSAKSDQEQLTVPFTGGIRASSPDTLSNISIDDLNNIRIGRIPDYLPVPASRRHASSSPAPPKTLKGKAAVFWTRNKGLALVLLAQVFGTLMNVTTRLLEVEGNHGMFVILSVLHGRRLWLTCVTHCIGKGLDPFQVIRSSFSSLPIISYCDWC